MEEKNIKVEKVKIHKEGSTWILDEPFMDFSDTFEQRFGTFNAALMHSRWLLDEWYPDNSSHVFKRVWTFA